MTFKIDVSDDEVVTWSRDSDGDLRTERTTDYEPAIYVSAPEEPLTDLRSALDSDPKVASTATVRKYTRLDANERETVLQAAISRPSEIATLAREIRGLHERDSYAPGTFRLYDVDFSPQFRYCVETDTDPTIPDAVDLSTLEVRIAKKRLADSDLSKLEIDGESLRATPDVLLEILVERLAETDPDVLVVNHGELIPLLYQKAEACGREEFDLGRELRGRESAAGWSGFRKLAGASTYESYGQVGHSPARYDVTGRALVDTSNSFLWGQAGLAGLRYLSAQSWKPLQEVGWASIGNVLTAIQIREARSRDVLVPWNKWQPESFKDVRTLHAADRGGFTFAPEVGLHEEVYEVDFASLYPRIICEYNVSPDTVLCDCHADREDVPEIGYNLCDDRGFLADVLGPLLEDRAEFKETIRAGDDSDERTSDPDERTPDSDERTPDPDERTPDPDAIARARRTSNAIKWILVSCFGYQGYRNAKFGRIECHEAINAIARDLLLTAKETFEEGGWEVVHGIVDSLWVTPRSERDQTDLSTLTHRVSEQTRIPLEHEGTYDWLCFVPKRDSRAGALNRYFGKVADETEKDGASGEEDEHKNEYKLRGIEARQRSTPPFIERVQRDLLDAIDRYREPAPVCDVLKRHLRTLRSGDVSSEDLLITRRASKRKAAYSHRTRTVAALERAEEAGLDPQPGQSFDLLVVDDSASRTRERVRLDFEVRGDEEYDSDFYADRLLRAAESVLSPLGWDETRIRRYLRDVEEVRLSAFGGD